MIRMVAKARARLVIISLIVACVIVACIGLYRLLIDFERATHKRIAGRMQAIVFLWRDVLYDEPLINVYRGSDGQPLYSWRLYLAWRFAASPIQLNKEQQWDSENNMKLADVGPLYFSTRPEGPANYVVICGHKTVFDSVEIPLHVALRNNYGKVALIETENGPSPWMAPGDLSIEKLICEGCNGTMESIVGKPNGGNGFHVVLWSGDAYFLSSNIPVKQFAQVCVTDSSSDVDFASEFRQFIIWKSE